MPTRVVLDSTAVAALFFRDPLSEEIARSVSEYDEFHTLDLAYAEVGSVAWKLLRIFHEDRRQVMKSLKAALGFVENDCKVISARDFLLRAVSFGLENEIAVYHLRAGKPMNKIHGMKGVWDIIPSRRAL